MTAREMFEELEYELIQDDMHWVVYAINKKKWCRFEIAFLKHAKSIHLNTRLEISGHSFDIQELKAINKQVEELGWYDDSIN